MYIYMVKRVTHKVSSGNFQFDYPRKQKRINGMAKRFFWSVSECSGCVFKAPECDQRKDCQCTKRTLLYFFFGFFFYRNKERIGHCFVSAIKLPKIAGKTLTKCLSVMICWALKTYNHWQTTQATARHLFWTQKRTCQSINTDTHSITF